MIGRTLLSDDQISLQCDSDIGKYLRSLFYLTFGVKLKAPMHKSHVMVTFPGETFSFILATLSFNLNSQLFTNGNAIWVDVISQDIINYRTQLGLGDPPRPIHYCIGYFKDGKNQVLSY